MRKAYIITREMSEDMGDFYKHFRTDVHKVFTSLRKAKEYIRRIGRDAESYEPIATDNMVIFKVGKWKYDYMLHVSVTE